MNRRVLSKATALLIVCVLILSAISLSGCSGYGSSTPSSTPPSTTPPASTSVPIPGGSLGIKVDVTIADFSFSPGTTTIPVGATVIWTNKGSTPHTVTSHAGVFNGSVSPGSTFSFTFSQAGTFTYHCNIHPSMTAKIVVTP